MTVKRVDHNSRATMFIAVIVGIAALRLGRDVLIPFALAFLLSFLLAPVVFAMQRFIGRVAAVVVVTVISFSIIAATGWLVIGQMSELAQNLPEYRQNITQKARSLREAVLGKIGYASRTMEEISAEISGEPLLDTSVGPVVPEAKPPQPSENSTSPAAALTPWIGPLMFTLGDAAVVIVFVIFMLVYYDDLRDRVLRLAGIKWLNETTQALNDAGQRVSRYLFMQSVINASHGVVVGLGLYFLGVPAAFFFGLSSALLRFIPYLGPVVAATMPIVLSFAVFPNWTQPVLTVGLFIVLEIISNNVLEPWLYGSSTGLSPMAVIFAAVFWTWLWGGVGLILSAPLTVCLAVLGKHIAPLHFLNILLRDQPVLEPKDRFYQRLLAMDMEGAFDVAEQYLVGRSLEEVYDEVLLPALARAEKDRHSGGLEEAQERFILESMKVIVEDLAEASRTKETAAESGSAGDPQQPGGPDAVGILCLPARDDADVLAGLMFVELLERDGYRARCPAVSLLSAEMVDLVESEGVQIVCISAVPPSAIAHATYLCKRLRARYPDLNIVVGLWRVGGDPKRTAERIERDKKIKTIPTLAAGRELVRQLAESVALLPSSSAAGS